MPLSASDTSDLLVEKLLAVGFKIDTTRDGQDEIYAALQHCTILPPANKRLTAAITVALEHGLPEDTSCEHRRVRRQGTMKKGVPVEVQVEIRDFDVADENHPCVCKDKRGRLYFQALYQFP
jgi:hypothetical protein